MPGAYFASSNIVFEKKIMNIINQSLLINKIGSKQENELLQQELYHTLINSKSKVGDENSSLLVNPFIITSNIPGILKIVNIGNN